MVEGYLIERFSLTLILFLFLFSGYEQRDQGSHNGI
jgi:hypothetical protein